MTPGREAGRRRWSELLRREHAGDYFGLAAIRERAPDLYHLYVGQYEPAPPAAEAEEAPRELPPAGLPPERQHPAGPRSPQCDAAPPPPVPLHEALAQRGPRRTVRYRHFGAMDGDPDAEVELSGDDEGGDAGMSDGELPADAELESDSDDAPSTLPGPAPPAREPPPRATASQQQQQQPRPPSPTCPAGQLPLAAGAGAGATPGISEEEKAELFGELQALMKRSFLDGRDAGVDYAVIDADAGLDECTEAMRDDEDAYFDDSSGAGSPPPRSYRDGLQRLQRAAAAGPPPGPCDEGNNWGF